METEPEAATIGRLTHVTLFVEDQEDALEWYTGTLGFEKREDEAFEAGTGETGRWLTVAPPDDEEVAIALVAPDPDLYDEETVASMRAQLGRDTWWTLSTDDCEAAVEALAARGATVTSDPVELPWGVSAMVADPDGNEFNLLEPAAH